MENKDIVDGILDKAFIKAMELKDYENAHSLNRTRLVFEFNMISYDEYCQRGLAVLKTCDYMYNERKQMEDVLNG